MKENLQATKDALKDRNTDRHNFTVAQLQCEKLIADEFEKLVKKFKNIAVPKIIGVVPKQSGTSALTAPLERIVAAIRQNQAVLEKHLRLMEKMNDVSEVKGASGKELVEMLGQAEDAMGADGHECAAAGG